MGEGRTNAGRARLSYGLVESMTLQPRSNARPCTMAGLVHSRALAAHLLRTDGELCKLRGAIPIGSSHRARLTQIHMLARELITVHSKYN